jgi:DNA-binding MarR family transcriptional regulator
MGLTRQSVQRLADALVEDGFARWRANPRHQRAKLLEPTPRAFRAIRRITERQHPWSSQIGDAVGGRELRRTARTLERILAEMQEHPPA